MNDRRPVAPKRTTSYFRGGGRPPFPAIPPACLEPQVRWRLAVSPTIVARRKRVHGLRWRTPRFPQCGTLQGRPARRGASGLPEAAPSPGQWRWIQRPWGVAPNPCSIRNSDPCERGWLASAPRRDTPAQPIPLRRSRAHFAESLCL